MTKHISYLPGVINHEFLKNKRKPLIYYDSILKPRSNLLKDK